MLQTAVNPCSSLTRILLPIGNIDRADVYKEDCFQTSKEDAVRYGGLTGFAKSGHRVRIKSQL